LPRSTPCSIDLPLTHKPTTEPSPLSLHDALPICGLALLDEAQDVEPRPLTESQIGDGDVELLFGEGGLHPLDPGGAVDGMPLPPEEDAEHLPHGRLVVDDEDGCHLKPFPRPAGPTPRSREAVRW